MPKGLYRTVSGVPEPGMLATSCLTPTLAQYGLERGYLVPGNCPTGIQPVMKKILAVEGDVLITDEDHLVVNDVPHPEIHLEAQDSRGRKLKRFAPVIYQVPAGQAVLYSAYVRNSWDGRFWGTVPVKELVRPLWTAGGF